MNRLVLLAGVSLTFAVAPQAGAQPGSNDAWVFAAAHAIQPKVVAWRRDIHAHPELSNQEVRTARLVADHLRKLGLDVRTGVAGTGVIGVLKGGKPGPAIVLRADMDALPVAEAPGLPFASKATATWNGATVPVMHACGHDAHTAMLMGSAEVLASLRSDIAGTIVFLFQPAEEGAPGPGAAGAQLVVQEKALAEFAPAAFFGTHVVPGEPGSLSWRKGPFMAGSDTWEIKVDGKQTHGAIPWGGIDAASVAADIVTAFNQIAARQLNVSRSPVVLTVGQILLGQRHNIIPGKFEMTGTLRTFAPDERELALTRIKTTLASVEARYGAKVKFDLVGSNPVTANDAALAARMASTLARAAPGKVNPDADYVMASEDFSAYQAVAPTFFFHLGIGQGAPNHSPDFKIDEAALETGVRAQVLSAIDYLGASAK